MIHKLTRQQTRNQRVASDDDQMALAAVCVLIAQADGWVTPAERRRTIERMRETATMRVFDCEEIALEFELLNRRFDRDPEAGEAFARAAVQRLADHPDLARNLIETACAVAEADGGLDAEERDVILSLCGQLDLQPAEFDITVRKGDRR